MAADLHRLPSAPRMTSACDAGRLDAVHVRQQDGELVASEPGHQVAAAPASALRRGGDLQQQLVAAGVAEGVVDLA